MQPIQEEEEEHIPLDNEEMLGQLKSIFDNGLGEKDIKDLFRLVCLDDPNLANTMLEELQYWSKHGSNSEGKVQDLCYSL